MTHNDMTHKKTFWQKNTSGHLNAKNGNIQFSPVMRADQTVMVISELSGFVLVDMGQMQFTFGLFKA